MLLADLYCKILTTKDPWVLFGMSTVKNSRRKIFNENSACLLAVKMTMVWTRGS